MSKDRLNEKVRLIAARLVQEIKLELVHIAVVGSKSNPTIRVFIDKPDGISHKDCELVSRKIEAELDADETVSPTYMLEVSSPGLERELYSLKDFERFAGKRAKLKTSTAINGQKNFRGRIFGVKGEEVLFDDKTNGNLTFPFKNIVKANLEIDLEEELKRRKR